MITSVDDWLLFLKQSPSAMGLPLILGGLGLMLFGWRLWKICVMISFGLIGATLVAWFVGPCSDQWLYATAGGAALALASYWPVKCAVSLLGGLIGAVIVMYSMSGFGVSGILLWTCGGIAAVACTGIAFLNRQHVVIVVTAFLGAVLVVSGLAIWAMNMPILYGTVLAMATGSAIVVPFILLVPTVMSSFYQIAEVRRLHIEL